MYMTYRYRIHYSIMYERLTIYYTNQQLDITNLIDAI